jgi:(E)-4-hydroxy-3-methylbut-2-enyl-diphosphate synthase
MKYCENPFFYQRRKTREVKVGHVGVGGDNPIRVQTMLISDTMNTDACVREAIPIIEAGCEILRITAPSVKDAENLKNIVTELRKRGYQTPIVADIHFVPAAALEAAKWVEKIRINPGNYADRKKFAVREYTDEQYNDELERIEKAFTPLVLKCKELGRAMRIGTNHGSLSDRILNRYGDTPLGMVESALEFARICRKHNFHDIIFSMKASNPKVMVEAYRLLVARLDELGPDWNYPLHLGVTEAGAGEDGRIKSAVGIGALLEDGVGDTIRVSLTEDSVHEIPVARAIAARYNALWEKQKRGELKTQRIEVREHRDPFTYTRRKTQEISIGGTKIGGENTIRVCVSASAWEKLLPKFKAMGDTAPEFRSDATEILEVDPLSPSNFWQKLPEQPEKLLAIRDDCALHPIAAHRILAAQLAEHHIDWPILLKDTFKPDTKIEPLDALLQSSTTLGSLLCDGIGDAVWVRLEPGAGASVRLAFNILQAAGARSFKTDYVACPSCGRTLFNLQTVTQGIKERTSHLKGVKIAVMGCIVNGPGEMADADFGYVGTAPGRISLWVGKTQVKAHIPQERAVDELIALIKEHGKWIDPPAVAEPSAESVPAEVQVNQ